MHLFFAFGEVHKGTGAEAAMTGTCNVSDTSDTFSWTTLFGIENSTMCITSPLLRKEDIH